MTWDGFAVRTVTATHVVLGSIRRLPALLVRGTKTVLFRCLGLVFAARQAGAPRPPRRILVLQLQQLGDSVIFTPTLRALRERFPAAQIDLLASPIASQVYKKSRHVNKLRIAEPWSIGGGARRIGAFLPKLAQVRAARYDCVIADVTQQAFKYTLIAWLTRAPMRVGFSLDGRGFLHTVRVPLRARAHWVDANLDIARVLGATPTSEQEEVAFDDSDVAHVQSLLARGGHVATNRVIALHTGANWQSRTWYGERWAVVADALATRHRATIVFVGAASEREHVDAIRATMQSPSISLAGGTDIPQLAALCSIADLFAGTDSGPRQIARAAGCPHVVVMCAQDDTDRWVALGKGGAIARGSVACRGCYFDRCAHKLCMDSIDAEWILSLCATLLADAGARSAPPRAAWVDVPPRLKPLADRGQATLRSLARSGG